MIVGRITQEGDLLIKGHLYEGVETISIEEIGNIKIKEIEEGHSRVQIKGNELFVREIIENAQF